MVPNSLLAQPLQPRWDRRCERCGKRWALEWISDRPDLIAERVVTYRCKCCGVEIEYADAHPPRAI